MKLHLALTAFFIAGAALAADKIYWTNEADNKSGAGAIQVGNQCGIAPAISLFTGESAPCSLTIYAAANKIYWGSSTGVRVANLDGSGFAKTLYGDTQTCGVAADPVTGKIYWINEAGDIKVAKLDGNGTITTLFAGTNANALTIDQKRIYWTNDSGEVRWGLKSNTDSSSSGNLLYSNETGAKGIALDQASQKLYWTNSSSGIIRVGQLIINNNLTGASQVQAGQVVTLYSGENEPTGISIDSASRTIYWANRSTGDIRVGSTDGCLKARSLYSLQDNPTFPIILQTPIGLQEPQIFSTCQEDACDNITPLLGCSGVYFMGDDYSAFLYRTGMTTYSWFLNETRIATTASNFFSPTCTGSYVCSARTVNPAGECVMSSESLDMIEANDKINK